MGEEGRIPSSQKQQRRLSESEVAVSRSRSHPEVKIKPPRCHPAAARLVDLVAVETRTLKQESFKES